MLTLSSFVAAYHRPVVARAGGRHALVVGRRPLVRAVAAADECLTEAPDASAADACEVRDPEATLQRYLQLRTVLSGEPLPDAAVESLVRRVEELSEPGFDEERIWGEWQLCWQRNAAAAPRSQKALAPLPQFANFMTDERGAKVFRNIVQLTARRLRVVADVAYTPPPETSVINSASLMSRVHVSASVNQTASPSSKALAVMTLGVNVRGIMQTP